MVHQHGFRAKTWYYQWNTLNQLIACFNPEGECWRYTYDAFGRRLSKSKVVDNRPISPPNSPFKNKRVQRVDYLWSGDQMVQETPIYADGTPAYDSQIQWLYQPGEITPTARYQRGKLHYVVTDHQGTPREIFSEKGIVSWAGRLNTWGQMAFWQSHDDYADNDPEYTECHFRFAGQYEDKESGLYYNRFRYYDKDTGQYISPDPIGLLGGFNPYGYVHCPTGWVDPFGLTDKDIVKVRHHTSVEGLEGIKRDQSIWPARGEPIGVHVEVAPFSDAHNGGYAVGANGKGSYVEFEVRRDTLVKTFIWSERNTAIIASNQPLSLKDKKAVFKKQSWWSRMMKGGCK
ncbi:RHS repeat domain-containing protein [Proteus terrae]